LLTTFYAIFGKVQEEKLITPCSLLSVVDA